MLLAAVIATSLISLTGCGAKTRIVLLPDSEGKAGHATVTAKEGAAELDALYQTVEVSEIDGVLGPATAGNEEEINNEFKDLLAFSPLPPVSFLIFFKSRQFSLPPETYSVIYDIIDAVKKRDAVDISIIGHSDTSGSEEYNRKLSRKRAQMIYDLLKIHGVDENIMSIEYHGESRPLKKTADGVSESANRRVEVTVR